MITQYLGLVNYWVVIALMMTGFYIVIAQHNLIKSIIGLNLFQTSVFLLYITMGKVRGGTAPIIPPEIAAQYAKSHESASLHDAAAIADGPLQKHIAADGHSMMDGSIFNPATSHSVVGDAAPVDGKIAGHVGDLMDNGGTVVGNVAGELIYSNPLPSVLMLTAIVVGIATTALALALIVRIREDYGTIEEDEILAIDIATPGVLQGVNTAAIVDSASGTGRAGQPANAVEDR